MSKFISNFFCHRYSGADYIIRSLSANYITGDVEINYNIYDTSMYKSLISTNIMPIYVVRDGRDTITDMYNYFRMQPGTMKYFDGKTFRHYIMGNVEAYTDDSLFEDSAKTKNPLDRKMFSDPIGYWVEHVESFINSQVDRMYFINYELMLLDPIGVLMHIGDYFNLTPRNKLIESLEDLICYKTVLKEMGIWRLAFEEKDLQYFWGKSEDLMVRLKYSYT